ncbi:MAG: T9SS type A sorting domain-containing protein, partial [Fibrobacter sp.]|nr:T9SS type A sorting domain-containing protein [Fibrobacter sp.]
QVVNVIQSVMNTESTNGAMVKTPTFYVFKMYIPHHTDEAKSAPFTLTSERVNNMPAVSAAASVNKSGIVNVSLTNIDLTQSRTVNITLANADGNFECTSAKVVTGPAKNSWNNYNQQETVNMKDLASSNYSKTGDRSFKVTLPPMSIAMLSFTNPTGVDFNNTVSNLNKRSDFSVGSGSNGSITVTSLVSNRTPVSISLYRLNGKTLLHDVNCTFETGKSSITLGKSKLKKGVYLVKITGKDINLSKQVAVSR